MIRLDRNFSIAENIINVTTAHIDCKIDHYKVDVSYSLRRGVYIYFFEDGSAIIETDDEAPKVLHTEEVA